MTIKKKRRVTARERERWRKIKLDEHRETQRLLTNNMNNHEKGKQKKEKWQ